MKWKIFDIFSMIFCLGLACMLTLTFFLAFVNDNSVIVNINGVGEKWVEAVFIPVAVIMGFVTLFRMLKGLEDE